jgi:heat shock protein HslJ
LALGQEGFDGFAGCNGYGGEYEAADNGILLTADVWQTAMECDSTALTDQEQTYVEALRSIASYRVKADRLEMFDAGGDTILIFAQEAMMAMNPDDLLDTVWQLVSLDGESLSGGATITLAFHDEHLSGGDAGCRDYVASYEANSTDLKFPFFSMIEANCSGKEALMEQEGRYTTLLGWATGYRVEEGKLEILTKRGEVLVFEQPREVAIQSLEGTSWTLSAFIEETDIDEMAVPLPRLTELLPETQITARFENGTVNGSVGCNTYAGPFPIDRTGLQRETFAATEMGCPNAPSVLEQEQRYLEILGSVATHHVYHKRLWLETGEGRILIFSEQAVGDDMADMHCAMSGALPPEEAELVWPILHQLQPDHAAAGDQVEVRGTGGFLYWNNTCGEFRDESARDFQRLFDGEPLDSITCYVHTCLTNLTVPAGAALGVHTISIEGGSSIGIEVVDEARLP